MKKDISGIGWVDFGKLVMKAKTSKAAKELYELEINGSNRKTYLRRLKCRIRKLQGKEAYPE